MQSVNFRFFTRTGRGAVLALVALVAAGCADQDVTAPTVLETPSFSVSQESATLFETNGVLGPAWGTATIRRGPQGVQVQLTVTDPAVHAALEGNAISIWVASFHNPAACTPGPHCIGTDLDVPATEAALQLGGGRVLGSGPITFAINVREGDTKNQIRGTAAGLVDAETDEIHVVIRRHGPPVPGLVDDQISTPAGGCSVTQLCSDVAVAIFF
jgi:hypothetical protein